MSFDRDNGVIMRRQVMYPVAGAHAEVSERQFGPLNREHSIDLVITLASGQILNWYETGTGIAARTLHNEATAFAAAVNTDAALPA
jgi:hypothetical protein